MKPNMKSFALFVLIGLDVHTVPYPLPPTPVLGSVVLESNGLAVLAPETPKVMTETTVGWDIVTVILALESGLLAMAYHSSR